MDKKPAAQFAEALTILNSYQRALIARIAEETVENRSDFEACYLGKAEDIVERYGHLLYSLGTIQQYLHHYLMEANQKAMGGAPGAPVNPSGKLVQHDTPLVVGSSVLAEWYGLWWRAKVVSIESEDDIRIHYVGWDDQWDETVPRSRLQEDVPPSGGENGSREKSREP
jgi:hypothetical protein